MEQEEKKQGSMMWLWILIAVIIIVAVVFAWWRMKRTNSNNAATTTSTTAPTTAPKNADWLKFTASKYGLVVYYPKEYTVAETSGAINISKGAVLMMDIYSTISSDATGDVKAQTALFTNAEKNYMTGGVESSIIAAGENAKKITGTFGKNAGAQLSIHDGIKGSAVIFAKNGRLWVVDSYDNGDAAAIKIFEDLVSDLRL